MLFNSIFYHRFIFQSPQLPLLPPQLKQWRQLLQQRSSHSPAPVLDILQTQIIATNIITVIIFTHPGMCVAHHLSRTAALCTIPLYRDMVALMISIKFIAHIRKAWQQTKKSYSVFFENFGLFYRFLENVWIQICTL